MASSASLIAQQPEPAEEPVSEPADPPVVEETLDEAIETVDDLIESMKANQGATTTEMPADVLPPPIEDEAQRPTPGRLLPEGARITRRPAWLLRDEETGAWMVYFPQPDERGRALPPMTLLPSRRLEYAEGLAATSEEPATPVEIAGQVYVYDNRNFLMPVHVRRIGQMPAPPPESQTDAAATGQGADEAESIDAIIANLKKRESAPGASGRSPTDPREVVSREDLMPDGSFVVSRLGRLARSRTSGEWLFRFESDTDGRQDPPVVLLPSRMLEVAVRIAHEEGDSAKLLISGPVHVYRERNYLIPTVIQRPYPRDNLSPAGE